MIRKFIVILLGLVLVLPVTAKVPVVPEAELFPEEKHERAAKIVLHIIDTYHYKKKRLDDDLSSEILDKFLENLDSNHSFFIQTDIDEFEQYRYKLDDALSKPNLLPAFKIFKRFRQRVEERSLYAVELLNKPFDFTIDEEFQFDRRESDWAGNIDSLNELWRKRVKNDYLNLKLAKKDESEIRDTLEKRYKRLKTSTFQLNSNDIFQSFVNAYTTAIEPHTSYFSPRTSENFDISMRLSLEGIGAVLRNDNDHTQVQRIIPGGPADLSGQLHADDRITGVGQDEEGNIVDVIGWRLDDVVDLIRGPKGSVVRLEVLAKESGLDGPSKIISITRDKIKLEEQAAQSEIIDLKNGGKIGVIDVPTFYSDFGAQARGEKDYKSTTRDVRKILSDLKTENIDGIIVDLRGNGGGSLSEALEFTGLFIERGPVVLTKDASGKIEINHDPDPGISYGGPLAVLVDRYSASASEIFAGAIQDYNRGIIIGEPTFGKGTVQSIVDLNRFVRHTDYDHGKLKTTIAQFFRISGGSNQHKGVVPDIVYPTTDEDDKHGERALDNALPWDQVQPARYIPASAPVDNFQRANKLHKERIKNDKLFQILLEQLQLARQNSKKTHVSLLETRREAERKELTESKKKLENDFRIAQGLEPLPDTEEEDNEESTAAEEEEDTVDVLLEESANILYDLIMPHQSTAAYSQPTQP